VQAYFHAITAHDWNDAAALLQPSIRSGFFTSPDRPPANTVSVSNVKTSAYPSPDAFSGDASQAPAYTDVWQVFATFDVVYQRVITEASGHRSRFIYVGRKEGTGPWTILEIGTGP
jgi:hypothetical protein